MPAATPAPLPIDAAQHGRVRVELGARSYNVDIGPGLLGRLGETVRAVLPRAARVFMIVDENVPEPLVRRATESLKATAAGGGAGGAGGGGVKVAGAERILPSESAKSIATWERCLCTMHEARLERAEAVVAIGGGIVLDIAGFAAASHRRGVRYIACPTTLLAMVDASVGGKTGLNLVRTGKPPILAKNMLGAFHQPSAVLADIDSISSLPERELRSGLAECIKHGLLGGTLGEPALLADSSPLLAIGLTRPRSPLPIEDLTRLITRNVALKARVIEGDEREERETGGRALLNLGHTFAHGLEAVEARPSSAPDPLKHGEAVALGLIAAVTCSSRLGHCDGALVNMVHALISQAGLPTAIAPGPRAADILAAMYADKKVIGGKLRLVLLESAPTIRARIVSDAPHDAVLAALAAIGAS
ncbi:MAG: 3-dehydroquinate synthase [Phycisphaerales bacterium]|nr:3-dehydroquinate synthase [Phycisphaerales bacterium]